MTTAAPLRVLVVDDEPSIRTLCSINLELAGMDVLLATSGHEALAAVTGEAPDVVVLDVMMPRLDGWQVAARLRERDETRRIPLVFLTARAERSDEVRAYELGALAFVRKPFDPLGLASVVREVADTAAHGEAESVVSARLAALRQG